MQVAKWNSLKLQLERISTSHFSIQMMVIFFGTSIYILDSGSTDTYKFTYDCRSTEEACM